MSAAPDLLPAEQIRPLGRAEYDQLVRLGAFEGEKLELLYGRLVTMTPQNEPHAFSITRLTRLLILSLGERAVVRVQMPLAASSVSEPEPDVAVVEPGDDLDGHPRTARLVVEVAHSSLAFDRRVKAPIYAEAGVPQLWIVDLLNRVVEVHADPDAGAYRRTTRHGFDETLAVPGFEDVPVAVRDILPPG